MQVSQKLKSAKIKSMYDLNITEFKFFMAISAQSWKVDKIDWKLDCKENMELHKKLEKNGLIKNVKMINNKNISADLTDDGIELYDAIVKVMHFNITK